MVGVICRIVWVGGVATHVPLTIFILFSSGRFKRNSSFRATTFRKIGGVEEWREPMADQRLHLAPHEKPKPMPNNFTRGSTK